VPSEQLAGVPFARMHTRYSHGSTACQYSSMRPSQTDDVRSMTRFGHQRGCAATAARRGQAPAGTDRVRCYGSGLAASEDILLYDSVNAPITVNHLGDAEVDANRN
jgi:hypothetical protein